MKVLVIGSRVPFPLRDGGAIATYNFLKGLSAAGLVVDYLSLNTHKHHVNQDTCLQQFHFLNNIQTFDIDTSVRPFPALLNFFKKTSYNIDRFTHQGFASMIQKAIDHNAYDLVHFEGLFVAQYLKMIRTDLPCILRQHNIEYLIWERLASNEKNPVKKQYLKFLAKRLKSFEEQITPLFTASVSITKDDEVLTQKHLNARMTRTISAGLEVPEPSSVGVHQHSVYHIGSMEWLPNQDAMTWFRYAIWPLVVEKEPEAMFYMGGKHMPESFKSYSDKHFIVAGEISDLNQFTADKSILAVPLRSGSGIRIKTIEAMMSGKAVVSTRVGAQGLPLVHEVNCLIADDENEFSTALLSLMRDKNLRDTIAENGRQMALSTYGNEAISQKWVDFYQSIV